MEGKKKLVFSFYVSKNFHSDINKLHFSCLEYFKDVFDCVDVNLIVENDSLDDYVQETQSKFLKIFKNKDISFTFFKNSEYRESQVFYDKIASKLSSEGLVFFAHNKGISNVEKYDKNEIYCWVSAMYFYSLNYINEVEEQLYNRKFYSYGAFLTKNDEPEKCNKYGWYYIGTFYWINCQKLYQYMVNNGIELPRLSDRFYSEEFIGNVIPTWPYACSGSHNFVYLNNCKDFYHNASVYLTYIQGEEKDEFNNFYEKMTRF